MLVTANLKSGGKLAQKEAAENSKLNAWAREQIDLKYKVKFFFVKFNLIFYIYILMLIFLLFSRKRVSINQLPIL